MPVVSRGLDFGSWTNLSLRIAWQLLFWCDFGLLPWPVRGKVFV